MKDIKLTTALGVMTMWCTTLSYGQISFKESLDASAYIGVGRDMYAWQNDTYLRYDIAKDKTTSGGVFSKNFSVATHPDFHKKADAATYVGSGRDFYLFKGSAYLRYDLSKERVVSGGNIAKNFSLSSKPYFHKDIDAACYVGAGRDFYLFKGNQYLRYDLATEKVVSGGSIKDSFALNDHPDFHENLDAACYVGAGRDIYLFKGTKYLRYDIAKDKVVSSGTLEGGFAMKLPKPLSEMTRYEILQRYAPVFHHQMELSDDLYEGQDLIVAVDQDLNWGTYDDDNDVWAAGSHWPRTTLARSLAAAKSSSEHDVTPVIYASFQELKDFYLCKYAVYHTYNELVGAAGDHLNDMEVVEVLIDKGGTVKGALSTIHGTTGWATPWASDDDMDDFDTYANETYTLHLWDGTHPIMWILGNSAKLFNLNRKDYGHAIFPQNEWNALHGKGISYYPAGTGGQKVLRAEVASSIGTFLSNWHYSSEARYLLVPIEELLIKNQMSTGLDKMYQTGQSMSTWSGRFWGTGYYNYADVGSASKANDVRYRYNDSYGGPDLNPSIVYDPSEAKGVNHPLFSKVSYGGLGKGIKDISGFHRDRYANIIGSGAFSKSGGPDLLSFRKLNVPFQEGLSLATKVTRVGKLHLRNNWFSNPYNAVYENGTGPTAGVMLRASDAANANFIYIALAPEENQLVLLTRKNGKLELTKERVLVPSNKQTASLHERFISLYVKNNQIEAKLDTEVLKRFDIADFGFGASAFMALVTQSDVNNAKNYYWTNAEYQDIQVVYNSRRTATTKRPKLENRRKSVTKLYPNPAFEAVELSFESASEETVTLEVFSIQGKRVVTQKVQTKRGANTLKLNISSLKSGIYLIKLKGKWLSQKLLVP